jgi:hypothetical protein
LAEGGRHAGALGQDYTPRSATLLYDEATRLSGRKLYPHQGSAGIDPQHRAIPNEPESQLPPPIHPLPTQTVFRGSVSFDNLTEAEFGALLASLDPSLLFGPSHGIRIGKAKPHGLGSVTAKVTLRLHAAPPKRFASLAKPEPETAKPETFITAFQTWVQARSNATDWTRVPLFRDLRALLAIPAQSRVRVYGIPPNRYGWMPDFNNATAK